MLGLNMSTMVGLRSSPLGRPCKRGGLRRAPLHLRVPCIPITYMQRIFRRDLFAFTANLRRTQRLLSFLFVRDTKCFFERRPNVRLIFFS